VFQSKMEPSETGVKVSVSLDSIGAEYRLDFDYELVMIERASFNLKVITPIRHHELYSVKFDIRGDNGGGSSQLELETPFRKLENVKASAEWTVDVQLYKLSGKIDADKLSGKFRAGFIGNDGEMKANFLLEAADLCLYSIDVSSDADFNSVATNMAAHWADEYNYAMQSKLDREEFSKLDWNLQLKSISEEENQWTLHFDLDIRDTSALYSHNLTYKVIHDQLDYRCYANVVTEGKERKGKVGIQWPSAKPLEADFTFKTSGKRMGKMNITLNTPWLEGPSAEIEVDINESQKPDIYKIKIDAVQKKLTSEINVKYTDLANIAGNAVVNTTLDWLKSTYLEFSTKSTSNSINGTYLVKWDADKMIDFSIFRQEKAGVDIQRKDIHGSYQVKSSWKYLPEASVHYATVAKKPTLRESVIRFGHNFTEVVKVVYTAVDSSSAGQDRNERQLEFRSIFFSTGMAYSHVFQYSGGEEGSNLPTTETRSVELFKVDHRPAFLFRTQIVEKTTLTGEETIFRLSNPRRTIEFKTHYDFPENTFRHGSEFR